MTMTAEILGIAMIVILETAEEAPETTAMTTAQGTVIEGRIVIAMVVMIATSEETTAGEIAEGKTAAMIAATSAIREQGNFKLN